MSQKVSAIVFTRRVAYLLGHNLWDNSYIGAVKQFYYLTTTPGEYMLKNLRGRSMSDQATRGVVRCLLDATFEANEERRMGDYVVARPEGKEYVVVKPRKPKCPDTVTGRAEYLRVDNFENILFNTERGNSLPHWGGLITSQICMRALFSAGFIDSKDQLLPRAEVETSLLGYKLLFDREMQEWRIWRK
jgi:hypothetical protein